jgi:hypothetical protein
VDGSRFGAGLLARCAFGEQPNKSLAPYGLQHSPVVRLAEILSVDDCRETADDGLKQRKSAHESLTGDEVNTIEEPDPDGNDCSIPVTAMARDCDVLDVLLDVLSPPDLDAKEYLERNQTKHCDKRVESILNPDLQPPRQ